MLCVRVCEHWVFWKCSRWAISACVILCVHCVGVAMCGILCVSMCLAFVACLFVFVFVCVLCGESHVSVSVSGCVSHICVNIGSCGNARFVLLHVFNLITLTCVCFFVNANVFVSVCVRVCNILCVLVCVCV